MESKTNNMAQDFLDEVEYTTEDYLDLLASGVLK